ncbi:MAG: ATP-binding cassette domain-containing protein [Chlamydiota bacterium]|nr:ATP-binding cassette domain-containing protein [Chlamydiota bacterium]
MIVIKNLSKKYGQLEVLKDLNLVVNEGETLVILGRSGVGKSVLLRQILGIEPHDSGTIEIDGKNLAEMTNDELLNTQKKMGMLFQGAALFDSMTVGENVAFYLRQNETKLSETEIKDRVSEALAMVDLSGTEQKMPSDLSGGMRKRAALARVIIYRPRIVLYDEPTTGLDPITAMQINKMIINTKKKLKSTSIVVTHDIKSAMEVGDRLAFHSDKKIAYIAKKDEFMNIDDPLIKAFFENASLTEEYLTGIKNGRS